MIIGGKKIGASISNLAFVEYQNNWKTATN